MSKFSTEHHKSKIVCYAVNFCSTIALHKNMRFNLENQNANLKVRPRKLQVPIRNTLGAHLARWSRKLRRDMMASPGLTCFSVLVISPSVAVLQGTGCQNRIKDNHSSKLSLTFLSFLHVELATLNYEDVFIRVSNLHFVSITEASKQAL